MYVEAEANFNVGELPFWGHHGGAAIVFTPLLHYCHAELMLGLWQSNVVYSNSVSNFSPRVPRFAQLMELIVQLWLTWLAMFLALLQTLTILTFEIWLAIFGVWSSRVSFVQDSAVLILNAEDGACLELHLEVSSTIFA